MRVGFFFAVILSLLSPWTAVGARAGDAVDLVVPILDQAPWSHRDAAGRPGGVAVELLDHLAAATGRRIVYDFMPLARVLAELTRGGSYNFVCMPDFVTLPVDYDALGPVMRFDVGVIARPSWRPHTLADLDGRTIAMGDAARMLLPQGLGPAVRMRQVVSLAEGLQLVAGDRLDGMVIADLAFDWALNQLGLDRARFGGWVPVMSRVNLVALNRASPLAADRDRLVQALAAMWADGVVDAIVTRYRLPPA